MHIKFTKMHGQGNDFVMLNGIADPALRALTPEQVRALADRHRGVGCDQVLLVEPADSANADFRYRIFNGDGGEVEHCGNGARCFAQFVRDEGLTDKRDIRVATLNRTLFLGVADDGSITVDMGAPYFAPHQIPFVAESEAPHYGLMVGDTKIDIGVVSMGNPHAVTLVNNVDAAAVATLGPMIEHQSRFPQRVNAGFMQILARDHIRLRVWERGVGETLACGTGACAAVVMGINWGLLDAAVRVDTRGGELKVTWQGAANRGASVFMSGTATTVFKSEISI